MAEHILLHEQHFPALEAALGGWTIFHISQSWQACS